MDFTIESSQQKSKKLLVEIHSILEEANEKKWIGWVKEQQQKLEQVFKSDSKKEQVAVVKGVMDLLRGGMGRFSDLYLCKENGHKVLDERKINKKLDKARNDLYCDLEELKFVLENYSDGQN